MAPWFAKALLALLLLGLQRFFYKVAAERGCDTARTGMIFTGTVAFFSWLLFLGGSGGGAPGAAMVLWGLVNGLSFFASAVLTMEALKRLPAAVGYSLTRLSTVGAALFSIFYFHDRLQPRQLCGILLAFGVVLLCAGGRKGGIRQTGAGYRTGLLLALAAMLAGTVSTISSKFAALQADKWGFMAVSYSFSVAAAILLQRGQKAQGPPAARRASLAIGLAMGGLNLVGFFLLLQALESGPLAIVAPLTGMHFLIAISLAAVIYRERPDVRSLLGIVMAVTAVLLMRS